MNPMGPNDPNDEPPSPLPGQEARPPYPPPSWPGGPPPPGQLYPGQQPVQPGWNQYGQYPPPGQPGPYPQPVYGAAYYTESANGGVVLGLGIVSIFILQLVLGPLAWVLGNKGVRAIDAGRANPAERANANAGRICGIIGTVIGVFSILFFIGSLGLMSGFGKKSGTLKQARAGFTTHLIAYNKTTDPPPDPPNGFELVHYRAPLGDFPAIIAAPQGPNSTTYDGRHPAIIWICGGFSNSVGDDAWAPATPDNDQSASAFYKAGVITMYPSLRGGNNNPGNVETCYGEVDDVLAAADYLATRPDVDPSRIYLGGHSTGGTTVLLAAATGTGKFRAVFSFGPIGDTADYGQESVTYNVNNSKERELRAPSLWLSAIVSPTFVIEGDSGSSNVDSLREMRDKSTNSKVQFIEVPGSDHFSELSRTTPVIAQRIMADTGPRCTITVSKADWPG